MEGGESLMKDLREPAEDDRSTKKAKFREGEGEGEFVPPAVMSFRDKLVQSDKEREEALAGFTDDFAVEDEDVSIIRDKGMPTISFSGRVIEELSKQWRLTVVVKLLGRPIGYRNLCNRLDSLWNFVDSFDVIDLDNDYFLVKFRNDYDLKSVITGGPWVMLGHYLSVQEWCPSFDCSNDQIRFINAWIRLPRMPIHYYNKKVLRYIGSVVGRVVKIDYCTEAAERGKFARIAVELDLKKPLVSQFCLDGNVQFVEYECLPRICFDCGRFGHVKDDCPHKISNAMANESRTGGTSIPADAGKEKVNSGEEVINGNPSFGPWMMVGRKGKMSGNSGYPRKNHNIIPNKENKNPKNRFDALISEEIEEEKVEDLMPNLVEENPIPHRSKAKNKATNIRPTLLKDSHAEKVVSTPASSSDGNPRKALTDMSNMAAHNANKKFIVTKAHTSLDTKNHTAVNVMFDASQINSTTPKHDTSNTQNPDSMVSHMNLDPDPPDSNQRKEDTILHSDIGVIDPVSPMDAMHVDCPELIEDGSTMDITMHGVESPNE
ncbi:uncharacterized protein LOC126667275 [Mercurialis annua]|uniref:uncharacterized protein LOC126667275 n=1 Tax=Mercurialis annua TaxID=3986 RepID=UPI0021605064|nr:uncharacterized protein LOC126667275 [Mercurialis annua]